MSTILQRDERYREQLLNDNEKEEEKIEQNKQAETSNVFQDLNRNVLFGFAAASLGGLLFGYVIGVTSGVVTKGALLCEDGEHSSSATAFDFDACYELDSIQKGALTSTNLVGALISTLFCFQFGDRLGRHREISFGALFYFIGSALSAFAPTFYVLVGGIFVYGIGIGFAMHAAPVYISEIAPASVRGLLVSCKEAIIVVGMLLGYLASYLFQDLAHNWRWMLGAPPAILAGALGICISTQKQSPRWLALVGQDPYESLAHFRKGIATDTEIRAEAAAIVASVQSNKHNNGHDEDEDGGDGGVASARGSRVTKSTASFFDFLQTYRRALFLGCGLVILQQVTGQPSVLYYANNIFKAAGFNDNAAIASVTVAFVKLVATIFSVLRVDRYGRRKMLFVGISMMLLSLVILALGFSRQVCKDDNVDVEDCDSDDLTVPKAWGFATIVALMVYVSGYQIGFGPVNWLIISEIFPLRVRASAFSVAAGANFVSNILVALLFGNLQVWLSAAGAYALYAAFCVVSLAFVAICLPETKGCSLEEIEALMGYKDIMEDRENTFTQRKKSKAVRGEADTLLASSV